MPRSNIRSLERSPTHADLLHALTAPRRGLPVADRLKIVRGALALDDARGALEEARAALEEVPERRRSATQRMALRRLDRTIQKLGGPGPVDAALRPDV